LQSSTSSWRGRQGRRSSDGQCGWSHIQVSYVWYQLQCSFIEFVRRAIEQEKIVYKENFDRLKTLKPEIEHITKVGPLSLILN
jgi:hypothetical protein